MSICHDKSWAISDQNRLLGCIRKGADDKVKLILQEIENPYRFFRKAGSTLLHYSTKYGNIKIVQHLLEAGCNINSEDEYGFTPLMLTIKNENVAGVEILLKNNADIYLPNCISLQLAFDCRITSRNVLSLKQERHRILEMLFLKVNRDFLRDKQRIGQLLLKADHLIRDAAVILGVTELANSILMNDKTRYCEPEHIRQVFRWTVIFRKIENAEMLIEHVSNVQGVDGVTKLSLDCYVRNCEAVDKNSQLLKTLLKYRNNVDVIDELKEDNFVYLLRLGKKDTVKAVLQCGINEGMGCRFRGGKPLLHLLLKNKNDVLDVLDELAIDFDVNARHENGKTPLMTVALKGFTRKVKFLLKHDADVNLTSANGLPALYYAALKKTPRIVQKVNASKITELLLQHGANAQYRHENGTMFNIYSGNQHTLSVRVFIAHLAFLEMLDHTLLTELIRRQIAFHQNLRAFFDHCMGQLAEMKHFKVFRRVTWFELLTVNENKLVAYLRNRQFRMAFDNILVEFPKLNTYYSNTLLIRIVKALDKIELKHKAASGIDSLTGFYRDQYHLIVYQIISFLNTEDLKNLSKVDYPCDEIIEVYENNRCTSCRSVKQKLKKLAFVLIISSAIPIYVFTKFIK